MGKGRSSRNINRIKIQNYKATEYNIVSKVKLEGFNSVPKLLLSEFLDVRLNCRKVTLI